MSHALILRLPGLVEDFLPRWTRHMRRAGYLDHTTAKREDCILSYRWFVEPLVEIVSAMPEPPDFPALLRDDTQWAARLMQTAERHRFRGVTAGMYLGCFKTLVHSIEEMLDEQDAPEADKHQAKNVIRCFADAYETQLVECWTAMSQREASDRLDESNRLLTLEKCKYENILASISDSVLVVDDQGSILEANGSAERLFSDFSPAGKRLWEVLALEGRSMEELLRYYPPQEAHEISAFDERMFFELKIVPLNLVSLASHGYIVVLVDITGHVRQRAVLEQTVHERTEALRREKAQLEELNITLKHVMNSIEKDREDYRNGISMTVHSVLLPALGRVRAEPSQETRKAYLDILEDQLARLAPGGGPGRDARLLRLTPTEMRVCRFIQAGSTSKDIAEALNLSVETVLTHRKNIRRKLKLQGQDVNLYTYLLAQERGSE